MTNVEASKSEPGLLTSSPPTLEEKIAQIPKMEFVEDVDAFMNLPENGQNAQTTLKRVDEFYHKLKVLEANNVNTKRRLTSQLEELNKTLEMLEEIKKRKSENEDFTTHFRLADHVHVKAKVKPAETIGLWLGANVMLEFELEDGQKLLEEKKAKAETSSKVTTEVIDSLREQITTVEVNMARIYNWDVVRRQAEKQKAGISTAT